MKEFLILNYQKIIAAISLVALLIGSFFLGRWANTPMPVNPIIKQIVIPKVEPIAPQPTPYITITPEPIPQPKVIYIYKEKPSEEPSSNADPQPDQSPTSSIRVEVPTERIAPPSLVYELKGQERLRLSPIVKTDPLSGHLYVGVQADSPVGPGTLSLSVSESLIRDDKRMMAEYHVKF